MGCLSPLECWTGIRMLIRGQCYWSKLDGNDSMTWADAHLTKTGIEQAKVADQFWTSIAPLSKIPNPERYYVSPLDRCLKTADITFSSMHQLMGRKFRPEVKEVMHLAIDERVDLADHLQMLREVIGIHSCDRRSSKSYIQTHYPDYPIEPGLAEEDPLWDANLRESDSMQTVRLTGFLDDVFAHDSNTFISFTSHSGAIAAILRAIGHQPFRLPTGSVMATLVKAQKRAGERPAQPVDPPLTAPSCTVDPTAAPMPTDQ